jgi:hypothetical protein
LKIWRRVFEIGRSEESVTIGKFMKKWRKNFKMKIFQSLLRGAHLARKNNVGEKVRGT